MMMMMVMMANGKGRHYFWMPMSHLVLLSRYNFRFPFSLSIPQKLPHTIKNCRDSFALNYLNSSASTLKTLFKMQSRKD